jgi:hypothetical protein
MYSMSFFFRLPRFSLLTPLAAQATSAAYGPWLIPPLRAMG